MRRTLIMGMPGAGKTTLATVLAPLPNAVVFSADAMRANPSRDLDSAVRIASSMLGAWDGCATTVVEP